MNPTSLNGGFVDGPVQSAHAFRAIMTAMGRPGHIVTLNGAKPPAPLSVAAGAVLLTLCDPDTGLALHGAYDDTAARDWITFHTGASVAAPAKAQFGIGTWADLPLAAFSRGTAEYPDRSATLIVEVDQLDNTGATLSGPGIQDHARLSLPDIGPFQTNARAFPLGLDFIFTCGDRLAALPRTTRVS